MKKTMQHSILHCCNTNILKEDYLLNIYKKNLRRIFYHQKDIKIIQLKN